MSAYLIALVKIDDAGAYQTYATRSLEVITQYGGTILARGGESAALEGEAFTGRAVIIRFPTLECIRKFYASQQYQQARRLREGVALARMIAVQGVS
jgi:uncharacterized protein (DUF1330 family)